MSFIGIEKFTGSVVLKGSDTVLDELDQLCINTVRFLSADAVQKANSGHPGMPLAAPMAVHRQ
jgi:hypothetical protein